MPNKAKVKVEVEETKNIKCETYCYVCQTYGHILSEKCAVKAVCLNCGAKGHVRRDCKEERCPLKDEIKYELKYKSSDSEEEYVEYEIPKDELKSGEESESESEERMKYSSTLLNINKEYIEQDNEETKKVKIEVYCILCQEHGHIFSEACVVNARCFACGAKGHVRKDCGEEKCELKNVKLEMKKESTKCEPKNVKVEVKKESTRYKEEYLEVEIKEEELKPHTVKKCSVYLTKVDIKHYEEASRKSNREEKHEHEGVIYACQECSYKSKRKDHLTVHIQAQHEGVNYTCKKCIYETKYKGNLKTHMQAEHEGISYSCKKCNYKSKHKVSVTVHMQAYHEGIKFNCQKCSYETKFKRVLTRHVKVKHESIGHNCQKCNFQSKYKSSLRKHMKTKHEGINLAQDQTIKD